MASSAAGTAGTVRSAAVSVIMTAQPWPGSGAGPSAAPDAPYRPGGPRTPYPPAGEPEGRKGSQDRGPPSQAHHPAPTLLVPVQGPPPIVFFLDCAALNTEQLLALSSFLCLYLNTDFHVKRVLSVGFDVQEC